jgi:NAD(P)-dependent dehydrogenase (short-subunit alcohol dehydrogenase family)
VSDALAFDGRVAVVTGAGRGLGRAYAVLLAARGAQVVVNDLGTALSGAGADGLPAEQVAAEIRAAGGSAVASTADVTDPAAAAGIVDAALVAFGRVDIVINNAGNLAPGEIADTDLPTLRRHLDVHVSGSFNVTRAAWPHLVDQGYGRVVLTTSSALFGAPGLVAYATAKGGVVALARSLAAGAAAGPADLRVNVVAPAAETRMVDDPELRSRSNLPPRDASVPRDPARSADEVAPLVALLAHERCPCTGRIFSAGGGRVAEILLAETAGLVRPGADPEALLAGWDAIVDRADPAVPASTAEYVTQREAHIERGS